MTFIDQYFESLIAKLPSDWSFYEMQDNINYAKPAIILGQGSESGIQTKPTGGTLINYNIYVDYYEPTDDGLKNVHEAIEKIKRAVNVCPMNIQIIAERKSSTSVYHVAIAYTIQNN